VQRYFQERESMSLLPARLVVLTYHRIIADSDSAADDEVDSRQFELHVETFARYFNVLTLAEAISRLRNETLPRLSVCITFDDGYRDNASEALPILQRFRVPATFFIASGFLDGGTMWNDRVIEAVNRHTGNSIDLRELGLGLHSVSSLLERQLAKRKLLLDLKHKPREVRDQLCAELPEVLNVRVPDDLMMSSDQVRELHDAGMEIGGHTRNHPILSVAGDDEAASEIADGKHDLEKIIGASLESFAYPNGRPGQDYDLRHVDMVKRAGFSQAVTTAPGTVRSDSDLLQLGRLSVWHRNQAKLLLRMILNYFAADTVVVDR
jgi:peptidoglycan/xylan/chitin deacetylase (PgdA/CDA1 family)